MKDEVELAAPDLGIRTKEFSLRIVRMFCALPKSTLAQVLGKQVLRSGTSVGANYRESTTRTQQTRVHLEDWRLPEGAGRDLLLAGTLGADCGVAPAMKFEALYEKCDQLLAILTTASKTAKSRMT